jgi:hypothetical protein
LKTNIWQLNFKNVIISLTAPSAKDINPVGSGEKPMDFLPSKEEVSIDKPDEEIKPTVNDTKPWRKNMKKSDEKDPST